MLRDTPVGDELGVRRVRTRDLRHRSLTHNSLSYLASTSNYFALHWKTVTLYREKKYSKILH